MRLFNSPLYKKWASGQAISTERVAGTGTFITEVYEKNMRLG